eukprot:1853086-Pyramimonas_sp.AAC.1
MLMFWDMPTRDLESGSNAIQIQMMSIPPFQPSLSPAGWSFPYTIPCPEPVYDFGCLPITFGARGEL